MKNILLYLKVDRQTYSKKILHTRGSLRELHYVEEVQVHL